MGKPFIRLYLLDFQTKKKSDTANNLGLIVLTGGRPVWPVIRDD